VEDVGGFRGFVEWKTIGWMILCFRAYFILCFKLVCSIFIGCCK
jgi:hypothetical protein